MRGLAEGFLIVDGTGMFERLPCGSPGGCITERRLESILTALVELTWYANTGKQATKLVYYSS